MLDSPNVTEISTRARGDRETGMTSFRLIAASKAFEVRTPSCVLTAERGDEGWTVEVSTCGREGPRPCLVWQGIRECGVVLPFRHMYLVSATERSFEVRFEARNGLWCHVSGDAQTDAFTAALCGDTPDGGAGCSVRAQFGDHPTTREGGTIAWPHGRIIVQTTIGQRRIEADALVLAPRGAPQPMSGHAPLATGYRYAEMVLRLSISNPRCPSGEWGTRA